MNKSLPSGRTVVTFLLWIFTKIGDQIQVLLKSGNEILFFSEKYETKFLRKIKIHISFHIRELFFLIWRFDPTPGIGLLLRGFAITFTVHTTLVRTRLDL
jgi:hypothetical protein